jgi:predicted secreted hydrolase
MRNSWVCLAALLLVPQVDAQYRQAVPGYRYEFPRDYFNHPEFATEWWYYTGNVKASDGHRFGFELTFFRQGVDRDSAKNDAWDIHDLYLAHLALSDLDGGQFFHAERTNRAGPGIAGVRQAEKRIWNGNWQISWSGEAQNLQAMDDRFKLNFSLQSAKPPVIHGINRVSQKAEGPGRASHYVSLTRLITAGEISLAGRHFQVTGISWMDHEFFTHQLETNQVGWDWMSVQFDDNTELMLFHIRRKDGSIDPYSSGTFVDAKGAATHLLEPDFALQPADGGTWVSPVTHAKYPIVWRLSVPKLGIELTATTPLPSQELTGSLKWAPTYWEGAISLSGHKGSVPAHALGYLEMTGYDHPLDVFR